MDLKDKLKYYDTGSNKHKSPASKVSTDLFRKFDALPVDPNAADVLKITRFFAYDHFCHEYKPMLDLEIKLPLLSRNRLKEKVDLKDILIFDLETTGLAGGAGTFPFLIGLGVFEETGIRVYQYFLPEYGREIIAYLDLAQNFSAKAHLLTYNGKTYDYPLIKNRFILNRIDNPFKTFQQIDLLHFARRLWKNYLPDCSLTTVEQEIFKFHRYGDIEGWLIPQAYFDFLQTGFIEDMQKIIRHNQQDIISLGRLLLYMHKIEQTNDPSHISDNDLQVLFSLAVRNGDARQIDQINQQLHARKIMVSDKAAIAYSLYLKRQNRWHEAVLLWTDMLESQAQVLFALEELAKYYEHHAADHHRARKYTERAINFMDVMSELNSPGLFESDREKFKYRLDRIIRKING